jgi:hypothetical protein
MTPFEDELKKALARREPGPGFTTRVLAQVESQAPEPRQSRWGFSWQLASVATTLLVIFCGLLYSHQVRVEQGEAAKQQLLLAMRIAGSELHQAQTRVKRIQTSEVMQ